jgi:predicted ArsR family transcriptional regulator
MQEELLLMNPKERARKAIMEGVKQGYFSVKEAAKRMDITPRQARRILRHYKQLDTMPS